MKTFKPPRPRLTLNIGITGHRTTVLSPELVALTSPILAKLLAEIDRATMRLHQQEGALFSPESPRLRLHTPLATGADQMAATVARQAGFDVRALLPFAACEYSGDFRKGAELREFEEHLEAAEQVFALPSRRADGEAAYVLVGKAVVAASDLMIAVWDGGEGNGPGGTAHVVDLAMNASVPVIHLPVDIKAGTAGVPRLIFGSSNFEYSKRPLDKPDQWLELLRETLLPQSDLDREQIAGFFAEAERTRNPRIEYPALLALLGVKKLPARPWRQRSVEADIANDWEHVRAADPPGVREPLARSYGWANFLAIRYAQLFRSGHVTNYVLSALAVNIALFGLIIPDLKLLLVVAELGIIGLLFLNTRAGRDGEWHRKWLQYRYLAETLRPFIYLKRTGMVGPPFRNLVHGSAHRQPGADWTRWYAAAIWREMDWPVGELTAEGIRQLAEDVVTEQILPQAAYHRVNAERMHKLDHRLHEIGNFLMGAVIAACFLFIGGYFLVNEWVKNLTGAFIFLTAGLPAISAAVFGMRGHGEHLLAASRSAHTVASLTANAERLRSVGRLDHLASELETSAAIMLSDLDEWTATYRERSLEIPA